MGLLDIFRRRRRPPIRDAGALAQFIDEHAAFLAQKGIYEYARARAGHYAKVLFGEASFQAACDVSRWRAFPLCLAMIGELVEGVLYPARADDRTGQVDAIRTLVLAVFDRYPVPAALDEQVWTELRTELDQRLKLIGLHPPKWAKDIPESLWERYFDLMPIHEKLRGRDAPVLRNYLRVTMVNVHNELTNRIDLPAVVDSLRSGPNALKSAVPAAVVGAN